MVFLAFFTGSRLEFFGQPARLFGQRCDAGIGQAATLGRVPASVPRQVGADVSGIDGCGSQDEYPGARDWNALHVEVDVSRVSGLELDSGRTEENGTVTERGLANCLVAAPAFGPSEGN